MFRKIIVLPENADAEQPVMRRAVSCAGRITEIKVFDVFYEPALEGYLGNAAIYEPLRARVVAERQERATALAQSLEARGIEAWGKAVWDHPRADAVARFVRAEGADLVVTTPLAGAGGALAQSDWALVSVCPAPVLVVKGAGTPRYRRIVAAVDPFHAHAKPEDLDAAILANAAQLQAQTGASLTVLHCFGAGPDLDGEHAEQRRREVLEDLVRRSGIAPSATRLVIGAPEAVLGRMADAGEADVIVMGALARGRIKDWLIGSTAERVLHRIRADVLAVNPAR